MKTGHTTPSKGEAVVGESQIADCENEAIHLLDDVQSYGVLIAVDSRLHVIAYSNNIQKIVKPKGRDVLQNPINTIIEGSINWQYELDNIASKAKYIGKVYLNGSACEAEVLLHKEPRDSGRYIVELIPIEPTLAEKVDQKSVLSDLICAMHTFEKDTSLEHFSAQSTAVLQKLTQYDRVLLYRFDEDWNGEVIGEACSEKTENRFLGLHFPASDIPKQARELYTQNPLRVIDNVDAPPARMVYASNQIPLDQSFCLLRQPSSMHILYCKNMAVNATLTLSLIHEDKLWGMLACHHNAPKRPLEELRQSVKQVSRLCLYTLTSRLSNILHVQRLEKEKSQSQFLEKLQTKHSDLAKLLKNKARLIQDICNHLNSEGAAIFIDGHWLQSSNLDTTKLEKLKASIYKTELIINTRDEIPDELIEFLPDRTAGLLALKLSTNIEIAFFCFRENIQQTITWGGNPKEKIKLRDQKGKTILGPRNSFESWLENASKKSEPWEISSIEFVRSLSKHFELIALSHNLEKRDNESMLLGQSLTQIKDLVVILERSNGGLVDSLIYYVNESVVRSTGFSKHELINQPFSKLLVDDNPFNKLYTKVNERQQLAISKLLFRQKNKNSFWGEITVSPILNDANDANDKVRHIAVIRNIRERLRSEERIRVQRDLMKNVTSYIPGVVFKVERDRKNRFRLLFINGALKELFGLNIQKALTPPKGLMRSIVLSERKRLRGKFKTSDLNRQPFSITMKSSQHTPTHVEWIELDAVPQHQSNGTVHWYGFVYDATERVKNEKAIEKLSVDLHATIQAIPDTLIELDNNEKIVRFQSGGLPIIPFTNRNLVGKHLAEVFSSGEYASLQESLDDARINGTAHHKQLSMSINQDNYFLELELSVSIKRNNKGEVLGYICIARDITERKVAERKILALAYFDPLTGLLNRRSFFDRYSSIISESERRNTWIALLYIDLDNFKGLNDKNGHKSGDLLLQQLSIILKESVREEDIISRVGGDEFVILIHGLENRQQASFISGALARKVLNQISRPFKLEHIEYSLTCSIGIALTKGSAQTSAEQLLQWSDLAMYRAKSLGKAKCCFYDRDIEDKLSKRSQQEQDLIHAVKNNQLQLFYQAIVDKNRKTIGYEGLLRWRNQDGQYIQTNTFIELAEQSDLILKIGDMALNQALETLRQWKNNSVSKHWFLSVNVSSRQFKQKSFVKQLKKQLEQSQVDPRLLVLELTETFLEKNIGYTLNPIKELSKIGVEFALDHFGTGYTSLSYLVKLPIKKLKIDPAFVNEISENEEQRGISRMILQLAETMGRQVIAVGIESQLQFKTLQEMRCHYYQGYMFGVPEPLEKLNIQSTCPLQKN